jgi:hypothetical protein
MMKKIAIACLLLLALVAALFADTTLDNELTFGNAKYFSYLLDAGFHMDRNNYGLSGSFSKGSDHDSSFSAGATAGYKINDTFNLSAGYKYNGNTSYPAYETPVDVLSVTYLWTFKQLLATNTLNTSLATKLGPVDLTPSIALGFNNLKGIFSVKKQGGLVSVDRQLTNSTYRELSPGMDVSYDITDSISLSAGGTRNYYNVDIPEILDASGATNTANRDAAALKTAVQFQVYDLDAGIMLFLGDFMASFTYTYTANYYPTTGSQNNFTNDYNLLIAYTFNEGFNMGVRLESTQSHYVDNTFNTSKYLGLQLNFTLK